MSNDHVFYKNFQKFMWLYCCENEIIDHDLKGYE